MKSTIDAAGRIVIPKAMRVSAGLTEGAEIEITLRDDAVIELQVTPCAIRIEQRGNLAVAVPLDPVPPMPADLVATTLAELRRDQDQRSLGY